MFVPDTVLPQNCIVCASIWGAGCAPGATGRDRSPAPNHSAGVPGRPRAAMAQQAPTDVTPATAKISHTRPARGRPRLGAAAAFPRAMARRCRDAEPSSPHIGSAMSSPRNKAERSITGGRPSGDAVGRQCRRGRAAVACPPTVAPSDDWRRGGPGCGARTPSSLR